MKEKIGECFIFIGFLLLYDNCDVKLYEILFSFIEICLIEMEKLKLVLSCDKEFLFVMVLMNVFIEVMQLQFVKNVSEGKIQSLCDDGDKKVIGDQIIDFDEVI